jgi:hypothetical protein
VRPGVAALRWLLAIALLVAGLGGLVLREAPASTWAVPISPGPVAEGWVVHEVQRNADRVAIQLRRGDEATRVEIGDGTRAGQGGVPAGRYRLTGHAYDDGPRPPGTVVSLLAAQVAAWEAQVPRPPRFLETRPRGSDRHRAQRLLLDLALLLSLTALIPMAPQIGRHLRGSGRLGALLPMALVVVVVLGLGTSGVWHANQHGYDRVADLLHGRATAAASLALLHGFAFYAVHEPLGALGLDPFQAGLVLGLATLALLHAWSWLLTERRVVAQVATLFVAASPVFLRVVPTESMYVPAVFLLLWTLVLFELFLRTDEDRWLLLAIGPLAAAMQSRAELLALAPALVVGRVLAADPRRFLGLLRRPGPWVAVLATAALVALRVETFVLTDKPTDDGGWLTDTWGVVRATVPLLFTWAALLAHPWSVEVEERLPRPVAMAITVLPSVALTVAALGLHFVEGAGGQGLHVHPALSPGLTLPLLPLLIVPGAVSWWRRDPGVVAWALGAVALGLVLYMPHQDCVSTYVRTGLTALPWYALLMAMGVLTLEPRRASTATTLLVCGSVLWALPFLTTRFPKQQQWDVLEAVRDRLPRDSVVVWLSEDDVPDWADDPGYRTTRFHLDRYLPEHHVVGIDAWNRGEAPAGDAFFFRTADCHRLPLTRGLPRRGLLGETEVDWTLLPVPVVTTRSRMRWSGEVGEQPACADLVAASRGPLLEATLTPRNAGSVYEEVVTEPAVIGLYRLAR